MQCLKAKEVLTGCGVCLGNEALKARSHLINLVLLRGEQAFKEGQRAALLRRAGEMLHECEGEECGASFYRNQEPN